MQAPIHDSLMAWFAEKAKTVSALENRLASVVCTGCSAGGDAVVGALSAASTADIEILVSSLLHSVVSAVCATG